MTKQRPSPRRPKSARDQAIDKALLAAATQVGAESGSSIIIRPIGKGGAQIANPPKNAKSKAGAGATNSNTAMTLALAKAGLAPAARAIPTEATLKPAVAPATPIVAPVPDKKSPLATRPSPSKTKAAKPTKDKKPKPPKDKKSQRETKRLLALRREASARARAGGVQQPRSSVDAKARAERMRERQKEAARVIANIGQATPDELLDIWRKNIGRLENPHSAFHELAQDYISAVESEWTRRSMIARLDPDYFKWPSTKAAPGNGSFANLDHAEGILGYLGYHVGKTGEQSSARRQALLARVFEGALPPINDPEYMREWDRSGSAIRLEKMAVSIASAVKSAKRRRDADYSVAIEHWEEDLKFLHRAYYINRFRFDWPSGASRGTG